MIERAHECKRYAERESAERALSRAPEPRSHWLMADDVTDEDYARRLVNHRARELSDDEIAAAFAPGMSAELGELVLAVLDAVAERLDQLEMKLDGSGSATRPPGRDRAAA